MNHPSTFIPYGSHNHRNPKKCLLCEKPPLKNGTLCKSHKKKHEKFLSREKIPCISYRKIPRLVHGK